MIKEAVILAGGKGLRLKPLTNRSPKAMIEINKRPIAQYQIEWLKNNGIEKVIFAAGYAWEKIKGYFEYGEKFNISIDYSIEQEPLGTSGSLKKAMNKITDKIFLAIYADELTNLNLNEVLKFHLKSNCLATTVATKFQSPYGIIEIDNNGMVTSFKEKPQLPHWVNVGIYVLNKEVDKYLLPKGDIAKDVFPILAQKRLLQAYCMPDSVWWRTVDTIKDLETVKADLKKLL